MTTAADHELRLHAVAARLERGHDGVDRDRACVEAGVRERADDARVLRCELIRVGSADPGTSDAPWKVRTAERGTGPWRRRGFGGTRHVTLPRRRDAGAPAERSGRAP